MSTHQKLAGIVLRTYPIRDSDLMTTVLTKNRGKLSALAKGARRSKRRFLGGIDVFDCGVLEVSTIKNNDSLLMLHGLSDREIWSNLRKDLTRYSLASLCLELTETFSPEGDVEGGEMFAPLYCVLRNLNQTDSPQLQVASAIYYTLNLLQHGGIDPLLHPETMDEQIATWFASMIAEKKAYVPSDISLMRKGFVVLLNQAEEAVGNRLRTKEEALLRAQKALAATTTP